MIHPDRHGGWIGCLDKHPVCCVTGARNSCYDDTYGFIGYNSYVLCVGAMIMAWLCGMGDIGLVQRFATGWVLAGVEPSPAVT